MRLDTTESSLKIVTARKSWQRDVVLLCRGNPLGALAAVLLLVMILAAAFAETLATHDPIQTDAEHTLAHPDRVHWFGTDNLGRDIYSRIVYGARVSLAVGIASTFLGAVFGGIIGVISGYFG